MITEKELLNEIENCQQEPITGSKREVLADLIIIYDYFFGEPNYSNYSYSSEVETPILKTNSDTEFLKVVNGKNAENVLNILDELMSAIEALHPRMYSQVIQKISEI